jgi:transcriptional regulator with XRE-family HTH domain
MNTVIDQRTHLLSTLQLLIDQKGISQRELALHTNMEESNLSRIFAARYSPKLDNLLAILTASGITMAQLWQAAYPTVLDETVSGTGVPPPSAL